MKINIICSEVGNGWVYDTFIKMFKKYSQHEIMINQNSADHDIDHYLPYFELSRKPTHKCTIWISHQEVQNTGLYNKFISSAKEADFVFSHSKKYMNLLKSNHGIKNIIQIMPGVESERYTLRPIKRENNNKLIVGFVGRQYSSSNRKNPSLLEKIGKLPFVDLRITGGKVKEENMPRFYAGLDVAASPSVCEGGPMAIQESLSSGVPFLCFDTVGVAEEFNKGIIKVKFGDEKAFLEEIKKMWDTKSYLNYRYIDTMRSMRSQILDQTYEAFVRKHDEIWETLK